MRAIPSTFEPSSLQTATLVQICVGGSDLILNFDTGAPDHRTASITVFCGIDIVSCDGEVSTVSDFKSDAASLMSEINCDVGECYTTNKNEIIFEFKSGVKFIIKSSEDEFECFHFKGQGMEFIV